MKFGQLIECNLGNIFLEKSHAKCGGEAISIHFSKKAKLSTYLDQKCRVSYSLLLLYIKMKAIKTKAYKLSCRSLDFTSYKAFSKNKKRLGTSPPVSFSA